MMPHDLPRRIALDSRARSGRGGFSRIMLAVSLRSPMRFHSVRRGACVMLGAAALLAGCGGGDGSGGGTGIIGTGQDPQTVFPPGFAYNLPGERADWRAFEGL